MKGVTSSGFQFEIDSQNLNNYELLESIVDMEDEPTLIIKVLRLLLGKEGAKNLKEHVREKNGFVDMSKVMSEVEDIFKQKEVKN
ncbi:hypothetical protein KG090_00620 [Carnobacteriaceae bacterium zg-ZUI240]|nr:hypothetical protein [Carnobacteriaceae bacterium zg-ZUI240]